VHSGWILTSLSLFFLPNEKSILNCTVAENLKVHNAQFPGPNNWARTCAETVVCIINKDEPDYAFISTELQQRKERKLSNSREKLLVHVIQITLFSPCTGLVCFQLAVNSDKYYSTLFFAAAPSRRSFELIDSGLSPSQNIYFLPIQIAPLEYCGFRGFMSVLFWNQLCALSPVVAVLRFPVPLVWHAVWRL